MKRNPYIKGQMQVSHNGNFARQGDARIIRTSKGWIQVSHQRDIDGAHVDNLAICSIIEINRLTRALTNNQPVTIKSMTGYDVLSYRDAHVTVSIDKARAVIPLEKAKAVKTFKIDVAHWDNTSHDEMGAYFCLYRTGSKTPAVKIYWLKP